MIEHALGHDLRVKLAGQRLPVMPAEFSSQSRRAIDMKTKDASGPEQKFYDSFNVSEIAGGSGIGRFKTLSVELRDVAIILFKRDMNGNALRTRSNCAPKRAICQRGWTKGRVQRRGDTRRNEWQAVVYCHRV